MATPAHNATTRMPMGLPCGRRSPRGRQRWYVARVPEGRERGRILRVGTPALSYHTIWEAERKRAVLTRNLGSARMPYRLYSIGWKFRGDCFSGSFDIVDRRGRIVMTHGLCWYGGQERVCVEMLRGDEALCLCIAAVVDSTPRRPLPSAVVRAPN